MVVFVILSFFIGRRVEYPRTRLSAGELQGGKRHLNEKIRKQDGRKGRDAILFVRFVVKFL
jgi:hypothetical protein